MKWIRIAVIVVGLAACIPIAGWLYYEKVANPRVIRELFEDPHGERAQKVMLLTLPSGRRIPANYLREGDFVYAGADGGWWKELGDAGVEVRVLVAGESFSGIARAVRDDPAYRDRIFRRLRPTAMPGFGTLVEIRLGSLEER